MADEDVSLLGAFIAVFGFGTAISTGYFFAGWVGALSGALVGATGLVLVDHRRRARTPRAFPFHNLQGLTPEQAAGLLAASRDAASRVERKMPAFKSDIVTQIEEALAATQGEPRAALARVEQLRDKYPRSAAVWAELVRRHLVANDEAKAWQALGRAIELALDGGMNSLAAKLAEEFPQGRAELQLDEGLSTRLERAVRAAGR